MTDVFFRGHGQWVDYSGSDLPFTEAFLSRYVTGVFRLGQHDEIIFNHTDELTCGGHLLPCDDDRMDGAFSQMVEDGLFPVDYKGKVYFKIDETKPMVLTVAKPVERLPTKVPPLEKPMGESEHEKLLKQIGAMALVLAERASKYKRGNAPNALQIANEVQDILNAGLIDDKNLFKDTKGTGSTELRNSISNGLRLLQGED